MPAHGLSLKACVCVRVCVCVCVCVPPQSERASRSAADSDDEALRRDFERRVAAAVSSKLEEAEGRVTALQHAAEEALQRAK